MSRKCRHISESVQSRSALRVASDDARELLLGLLRQPLDSFRYFEVEYCFQRLDSLERSNVVLDVSSPRVLPLLLLADRLKGHAHLLNPDPQDLALTRTLAASWGLADRCVWHNESLEALSFEAHSLDLVLSVSVVEHIADDVSALRAMWRLVRPGGKLLITVPVAAEAFEEYMDIDPYGASPLGPDGWSFASRYYDEDDLRRLTRVVGEPTNTAVFGERKRGRFFAMRRRKWLDPDYPYWREPYTMASDFGRFPSISALPGVGVVGVEWVKATSTRPPALT